MSRPVPSIGRVVHYVAYGTPGGEYKAGVHRAATVTAVPDDVHPESNVSLAVLNPTGLFFHESIPFDPTGKPGTWHWPEFVPNAE